MKTSLNLASVLLIGSLSLNSYAFEGCHQQINEEIRDLKTNLTKQSHKRIGRIVLPGYGLAISATVAIGMFPLGLALGGTWASAAIISERVSVNQMVKTASVLEISEKIDKNKSINSEDFSKLEEFYKLKRKLEKRSNQTFSDQDLANLIIEENDRDLENNILCSKTSDGKVILKKMNRKLVNKLLTAIGSQELQDHENDELDEATVSDTSRSILKDSAFQNIQSEQNLKVSSKVSHQ